MAKITKEILEIFANCISAVESGGQIYGNGRWNDITLQYTNSDGEHAITIGAYQRMGVEAKALLVRIRKDYATKFKELDNAGIGSDVDSSNWSRYQLPSKTCAKAKAIASIIGSNEGINIQKVMMGEDIQSYADWIENKYSIHRIDALLHLVNIRHLGGTAPLDRIVGRISGEVTLEKVRDSLLKDTVRNQVGADPYKSRQALMYKWIHEKITPLLDSKGLVSSGEEIQKEENKMAYDISKVINVASGEIGYLEKASNSNLDSKTANAGSGNYTKYWRDMANLGLGNYQAQYWCTCFVAWCFYVAYGLSAMQSLLLHKFFINCNTMANLASSAGRLYSSPQVGDIILFYKSSSGYYHTGIVVAVTSTTITTIEGNTSGGSSVVANGGGVARKTYNRSSLNAKFMRPNYGTTASSTSTATPSSKGYLSKGDTGTEVKTMQTMLIKCGYSCGSAGADGEFGNGTDTALRAFQKAYSLEVDGCYGAKSKAKLTEVYNNKLNVSSSSSSGSPSRTQKWTGKVNASSLNVRTWAGKENKLCSFSPLKNGVSVGVCDSVKAKDGSTWYFICYKGKYGFVHSDYVKK